MIIPGAGSEINGTVSIATSSDSRRSVYPPAAFVCFLTQGCSFLRQGLMRGEFLAVTFSWEMIGPAPKFGCSPSRSKSRGNRTGPQKRQGTMVNLKDVRKKKLRHILMIKKSQLCSINVLFLIDIGVI